MTDLEFSLTIQPIGYDDVWPEYFIKINQDTHYSGILKEITKYDFNVGLVDGSHTVSVGFLNKTDHDTIVNGDEVLYDRALFITNISIEGYELDDFLYRAVYKPIDRPHSNSSYLSWNGVWTLEIETPIFTWIHKTQKLGRIYGILG